MTGIAQDCLNHNRRSLIGDLLLYYIYLDYSLFSTGLLSLVSLLGVETLASSFFSFLAGIVELVSPERDL